MTFEELDQIRIKYKNRIRNTIIIVLLAFFVPTAILIIFNPELLSTIFFILFLGIFVGMLAVFLATFKIAKEYRLAYKNYFVLRTLQQTFSDLKYIHESGIPERALLETGMMRSGDIYESNDWVSGHYKDIAFVQSDVKMKDVHTDSEGRRQETTIFAGRVMIFEFKRDFSFKMQIVQKGFGMTAVHRSDNNRKFEKVEVESIDFNKKYKIYSQDGFETFYLLDPAFIEKIQKLGDNCKGRMMLSFIDNKLYVALYNNKDSFEAPNPFKKLDEKTELEKVGADIKIITDFIDELNLDKYLFKSK